MLIALINKTVVLSNLLGDIFKGILILITYGRFYLDKDMCTILISYDHPRYPGVDLARPHYLVSQSNHTKGFVCDHGCLKIKNMCRIQG